MKPAVVLTTVENRDQAAKLASQLVDGKLAACVNVLGPMTSFYFWEGKTVEEQEFKLVIKTKRDLWDRVHAFIRENHPYSVPEVTLLEAEMEENYLKWLGDYLS